MDVESNRLGWRRQSTTAITETMQRAVAARGTHLAAPDECFRRSLRLCDGGSGGGGGVGGGGSAGGGRGRPGLDTFDGGRQWIIPPGSNPPG